MPGVDWIGLTRDDVRERLAAGALTVVPTGAPQRR